MTSEWRECGPLVLADLARHERELETITGRIETSSQVMIQALAGLREDLGRRIEQHTREIERSTTARFEQVSVELARLDQRAGTKAAALGLLGGAIPAAAAVVYVLMRIVG